jgi:hypothetical protein
MANQLKMALSDTIVTLFRQGWSKRKIARQLDVDRGTVCRHIQAAGVTDADLLPARTPEITPANAATPAEVATGSGPPDTDSNAATPSQVATGSEHAPSAAGAPALAGKSLCEPFRAVILAKLEAGLTAQRIFQDLSSEHGFSNGYNSVKRLVRQLAEQTEHADRASGGLVARGCRALRLRRRHSGCTLRCRRKAQKPRS